MADASLLPRRIVKETQRLMSEPGLRRLPAPLRCPGARERSSHDANLAGASAAVVVGVAAAAAIVVYDITNRDTFQRAKQWVKELQRQGNPNIVRAARRHAPRRTSPGPRQSKHSRRSSRAARWLSHAATPVRR